MSYISAEDFCFRICIKDGDNSAAIQCQVRPSSLSSRPFMPQT